MNKKNKKLFLATTALEEFWDTSKFIVFLGDWCLLYKRKEFWQHINGEILKNPFNNSEDAYNTYCYMSELYERLLPYIGKKLNQIHGLNHDQRYWRIVVGPWLQRYLPTMFDRYRHITHALSTYPDCTTFVMDDEDFIIPLDTADFDRLNKLDAFNLQIFTKIFALLGKKFGTKKLLNSQVRPIIADNDEEWNRKLLLYLNKLYTIVASKVPNSIIVKSSYFSKLSIFLLLIKSRCNIVPLFGEINGSKRLSSSSRDTEIRSKSFKEWPTNNKFEQCVSVMLLADMPICFIEEFSSIGIEASQIYNQTPKAILSANSWYFDEPFKQWAALSSTKGVMLIGTPHGGSYGGLAAMPSENHETAVTDYYYSWGWERKNCLSKIRPFPATKLVGRKKIGASNLKKGILWAATVQPRYLVQFPMMPYFFLQYLEWQFRFSKNLSPEILPAVRFRPHREDDGWSVVERIKTSMPNLKIERWEVPFQRSLKRCRLYVCDHFSTTFAEALAVNKPTVLFWNPASNKLRPEAQLYYDLLRDCSIIFDSPEDAASAVNHIYDDVETWWNEPKRQYAVKTFCERFARNSPTAIEVWSVEFKRIFNIPSSFGR